MAGDWSFGQKMGIGFAGVLVLTVATSLLAIRSIRAVVGRMDHTLSVYARNALLSEKMLAMAERKASAGRGYLLHPEDSYLGTIRETRQEFLGCLRTLKEQAPSDPNLAVIERVEQAHQEALERVIGTRKTESRLDQIGARFQADVRPRMLEVRKEVGAYAERQVALLEGAKQEASAYAAGVQNTMILLAASALVLAIAATLLLTRLLKRQIGSAVQHIQSSSAELQAAANQQAAGSKEHATAMTEITVTIQELLATARQIAESAQRVAKIAEDTASASQGGDQTLQKAHDAVAIIKRQVDQIVSHMTELGRKSQQIGGILELINELAEQTNILAINATIEASGAGEQGKRFAAVADEIRKLADRVGGSTKEIRSLIDEIRAAVHTTVMATESGSKAVDAGSRQFGEVAQAFKQISGLVGTTTDAAREIELSTKQQSTAVEQVNVATVNVAQAAKESEASAVQTVQTASDLAKLSHALARLVQPQTVG